MDGKGAGSAGTRRWPRFGLAAGQETFGWQPVHHGSPDVFGDRSRLWRRLIPAFWLAFLVFPLSSMFGESHLGVVHATVVCVLTALFVSAYAAVLGVPDARKAAVTGVGWLGVVALFPAITTFLAFYDRSGWAYCFTFSLWQAAWVVRPKVLAVGVVTALTAVVGAASGMKGSDLFSAVVIVFGVGTSFLGFWRLLEANVALSQAQADQAQVAVTEERLRFARDLHDLLGHSLSVITLKSEVVARLLPDRPAQAASEVAEIEQVARQALWEVREAVSGYRRTTLAAELVAARAALSAASIACTEQVAAVGLEPAVEAVLAWAVREGVTNVVRHSAAASCTVSVALEGDRVVATVADDGRGVSGPLAASGNGLSGNGLSGNGLSGNGLCGLAERLALVGGALESGPGPAGGFRLRAMVPVASTAPASAGTPAVPTAVL